MASLSSLDHIRNVPHHDHAASPKISDLYILSRTRVQQEDEDKNVALLVMTTIRIETLGQFYGFVR